MATIMSKVSAQKGTVSFHLRVSLPVELSGGVIDKKVNIGISKLPEVYHATLKSRVEAFVLLMKKQVRMGKSPRGVSYVGALQTFTQNQITDMLLEHLGMSDMAITFNDEVIHIPASVIPVPTVSLPVQIGKAATGAPTLKEATEAWFETIKGTSLSTATVTSYKSRMGHVVLCVGEDTLINDLSYLKLKETLWNPEVSVSLHGRTANGQSLIIGVIKQFIKWCMEVYPTVYPVNYKNPASALRPQVATERVDQATGQIVRTVTRAAEQRDAFTEEEVKAIMGALKGRNAMEWFIMVSFLAGARLNELAQLHKEDVTINEEGLVSIRIARTFPDQTLKNTASERTIPLGFPDKETARAFYDFSQSQTSQAFFGFPYSISEGTYKPNLSRKWSTAVERLKVLEGGLNGKSQHSCRHTLLTFLKKCDVREDVAKQFAGHSNEANMTTGRYGKPYTPEELYSRLKDAGVYSHYY